jgi:hypothetical protein
MSIADGYVPNRADLEPVMDADGHVLPGAYTDSVHGALVLIASEFHAAFGFPDTDEGREETLALFARELRRQAPGLPIVARMPDGSVRDVS